MRKLRLLIKIFILISVIAFLVIGYKILLSYSTLKYSVEDFAFYSEASESYEWSISLAKTTVNTLKSVIEDKIISFYSMMAYIIISIILGVTILFKTPKE